jgi:hypothetical protein
MGFQGSRDFPSVVVDVASTGSIWRGRVTGGVGTPVLLLSASEFRTQASIYNHCNVSLFVGYDYPGVSTGSFDVKLSSGSYFEIPRPIWLGRVWGVWDAAGGVAMVLDVSGSLV